MASFQPDLDRWAEQGLISNEQRDRILAFEHGQAAQPRVDAGPGRLANGISTVGAAVAIAATAGILALFADSWSNAEAMLAAAIASLVMLVAAWQLVRNGWGAPAGLLAICGILLLPVTFGFLTDVMGWWPEEEAGTNWEEVDRERQRIMGLLLLISVIPGMLTTRLGLRQAWMLLPLAVWFGGTLLFANPFDNTELGIAQVLFGVIVAGVATFGWRTAAEGRSSAWWLQVGGLILATQGAAFSAFESDPLLALLGAIAAAVIFVVGATANRTAWMVAGALACIFPIGSLIFDYFDGLAGLIVVALVGLAIAFLPLMILRRRVQRAS